jgi:hypothetical protein
VGRARVPVHCRDKGGLIMTETQSFLQQQWDISLLWLIFAALACIIPIYYGKWVKKSVTIGLLNTTAVVAILFLYITFPAAKTIITVVHL